MQKRTRISLVKFDFKGFFNAIPRERLREHLLRKGLPPSIVSWIDAWLKDVNARYKIDGALSSPHHIHNGILQGSLLSPPLSILFTSEVLPVV